ncbi:hypothetical protein AAG906_004109 [Vitis piasezkii]
MEMKIDILSTQPIKPSSPTPNHLRSFKISLLDQLAPPFYVPVILLFSADDFDCEAVDHVTICDLLKRSLSQTLSRFYPLAGKLKGNDSVDCSDDGAVFMEARANVELSEILRDPEIDLLQKLLPCEPYSVGSESSDRAITAIQATIFECGGIGIGVCMSHKVADGATLATFLTAWSATAMGTDDGITPFLDSASLFPPRDINTVLSSGVISHGKTLTRRFLFDAASLARLQSKASNSTRVEAVTSLIWKSAMDVAREKSGKDTISSIVTHVVNLRGKTEPPLSDRSLGNLWQQAVATVTEQEGKVELDDLVGRLRRAIKKVDKEYVKEIQGEEGLSKACGAMKEVQKMIMSKGEMELYRFSSWSRFPFYETDFGFGRPIWVCTITAPIKNVIVLMDTKSGGGIEAWVTMVEEDMTKFQRHYELLEFVSSTQSA